MTFSYHFPQAMADLFALKCIYEEALFRNDDYVSPEKAKAIARLIEELCLEVQLVVVHLSCIVSPCHNRSRKGRMVVQVIAISCLHRCARLGTDSGLDICHTVSDASVCQVRGVAVPLCAAFAIPDHILRAPIGLATGQEDQVLIDA